MTTTREQGDKTNRLGRLLPVFLRSTLLLILILLLGACLNPFSSDGSSKGGSGGAGGADDSDQIAMRPGTGVLVLRIGQSGISTQTILPETSLLNAIETYDIRLENGPVPEQQFVHTGILPGAFPFSVNQVPTGNWTLTVEGQGSSGLVGRYTSIITITDGQVTEVDASVRGTQEGTGRLEYTLTWPAEEADDVKVEIDSGSYGINRQLLVLNDHYTVSGNPVNELSIALDPWPSGAHFLVISLLREEGENAPVIEAAQVYDNRTSSKTVNLLPGALTQPPAAPSGLTAEATGNGELTLSWTDEANTETGYRVYQYGEEIASLGPNTESHPVENLSAGSPYEFAVAAFNGFGQSAAILITATPITIGTVFFNITTGSANRASWVHRSAPGSINTFVDGASGTDSITVHIDSDYGAVENLTASEQVQYTPTGSFLDLSLVLPGNTYLEGETYYYRVEATNGSTTGSVVSGVQQFTIRDGNLYVATAVNGGAVEGAGSFGQPLSSVQAAIDIAVAGETINIGPGIYSEIVTIPTSLVLQGAGSIPGQSETIIEPPNGDDYFPSVITVSGGSVEIHSLMIDVPEDFETDAGIRTFPTVGTPPLDALLIDGVRLHHRGQNSTNSRRLINIDEVTSFTLKNSRIIANNLGFSLHEAVRVNSVSGDVFIAGNRIHTQATGGARNSIVLRNTTDAVVANNIMYRPGGITAAGLHADIVLDGTTNTFVVHNTFVRENGRNDTTSGRGFIEIRNLSATSTIANNLFVVDGATPNGSAIYNGSTVTPPTTPFETIEGNLFFGFTNYLQSTNGLGTFAALVEPAGLNQQPFAAGNFELQPSIPITPFDFDNNNWLRPEAPEETGNQLLVRSLVLAGGVDTYLAYLPKTEGSVPVDINGDERVGMVSLGAHHVAADTVIGAVGPAGGWVFHENPDHVDDGWRFLEAAHMDYGGNATRPWWTGNLEDVPGTLEVIGAGQPNTTAIVSARGNPDPPTDDTAGEAASVFTASGYGDWFLPSRDELVEMDSNLHRSGIGDFLEFPEYWSSTQSPDNDARAIAITFTSGNWFNALKDLEYLVRPVRRF